jgi:valyl-tRNA synthetase
MALNGASHNVPGEKTTPITAAPPSVGEDSKKDILAAAQSDPMKQSAPGKDGGEKGVEKKVKSEKELEKERKKAEKDAKFKAKKAAQAAGGGGAAAGKAKEKKKKDEVQVLPEYKEETPKGEKKILKPLDEVPAYSPKVVESAWYDWWERSKFFIPELENGKPKPKGSFVITVRLSLNSLRVFWQDTDIDRFHRRTLLVHCTVDTP